MIHTRCISLIFLTLVCFLPLSYSSVNFKVKFLIKVLPDSEAEEVILDVFPTWAPIGAKRLKQLVESQFFTNAVFFRVVPNFVVQFGLPADSSLNYNWKQKLIDDPVVGHNKRGFVTFATSGPNTRTTQLFINLKDNSFLDKQGFSPVGVISSGMNVIDKINGEYGEAPKQHLLEQDGSVYSSKYFPRLSLIKMATIIDNTSTSDEKSKNSKKIENNTNNSISIEQYSKAKCNISRGWFAAFIASIFLGLSNVVLKSRSLEAAKVHPLAIHTYCTFWMIFPMLFVYFFTTKIRFTAWALLSASAWMISNLCTIFSIQNYSLSLECTSRGGIVVFFSILWGTFYLQESYVRFHN